MVRSSKIVLLILLTALVSSGCYTKFQLSKGRRGAVETHYQDLMADELSDKSQGGKVVLPIAAQKSYNWNFYYNSAWWYDCYEYVPSGPRSRVNMPNDPNMITGQQTPMPLGRVREDPGPQHGPSNSPIFIPKPEGSSQSPTSSDESGSVGRTQSNRNSSSNSARTSSRNGSNSSSQSSGNEKKSKRR